MNSQEIIKYWSSLSDDQWGMGGNSGRMLDEEIREKFSKVHAEIAAGVEWMNTDDMLAQILVLNQFSKHIYRDDPKIYAFDEQARVIARIALKTQIDGKYGRLRRFFYFPFTHSENIDDVIFAERCARNVGFPLMAQKLQQNIEILQKYGRYPWRNKFLGRVSTPEEEEWLQTDLGRHKIKSSHLPETPK